MVLTFIQKDNTTKTITMPVRNEVFRNCHYTSNAVGVRYKTVTRPHKFTETNSSEMYLSLQRYKIKKNVSSSNKNRKYIYPPSLSIISAFDY